MKSNMNKTLILVVIVILLGVVFAPTLNAIPRQQIKNIDEENKAYFYCFIDINGTGDYLWLPIWGYTIGVNGTISVKAIFSMDIINYKIVKFNDKAILNGGYIVLIKWFIGTKSIVNGNLHFYGFAFCVAPAPMTPISK
jgi:hypothetical protein